MKTLSKQDLKRMNEQEHEDFVLINVLPRDHFNEQHIRTSVNVPHDRFDCDALPKAAKKLEEAGFSRVYDYEGGTKDWFEHRQSA